MSSIEKSWICVAVFTCVNDQMPLQSRVRCVQTKLVAWRHTVTPQKIGNSYQQKIGNSFPLVYNLCWYTHHSSGSSNVHTSQEVGCTWKYDEPADWRKSARQEFLDKTSHCTKSSEKVGCLIGMMPSQDCGLDSRSRLLP
jgi:hypothetical protein